METTDPSPGLPSDEQDSPTSRRNQQRRAAVETYQAQLEAVVDSMLEAVIVIDPLGNVLHLNAAATRLYDIPPNPAQIQTMRDVFSLFDLTYPDGTACAHEEWPLIRAAGGESITALELETRNHASGRCWHGLYNAAPVRDERGEISLVVSAVVDISEQRRTASEMQQTLLQLELQRLILQERERERKAIAQDLHDGLLQDLLALEFALDDALRIDKKQQRLEMLARLRASLEESARLLREFCAGLRPPSLAPFGLEKAIRANIEQLEAEHPEMTFQTMLMPDGPALSDDARMTVFRIYQELMNNVFRHSGASRVSIHLTVDEAQTELEVQDNGRGFHIPSSMLELARAHHFGLAGVQERAQAAGGRVLLRSQPGAGTLVRLVIPNSPNQA